jgi:hypothetical protein
MNAYDAVLIGGPQDGKIVTVSAGTRAIQAHFMLPIPFVAESPRPRWWQHPVRYLRWKPAPLPELPEPVQLRYIDDGTSDNGRRVFRLASPWQPYRGPDASPEDGGLYKALLIAMYAAHPAIRQDRAARWVMNLDWWKQTRRECGQCDDDDDDEKWKPSPEDMLLGIRIRVADDAGAPHLENHRFPQGWPEKPNEVRL